MYHAKENFTWFVVFFFNVFLTTSDNGLSPVFSLDYIAYTLIHHNNMVVLMKDLKVILVDISFIR
jgi:hypothetical protein